MSKAKSLEPGTATAETANQVADKPARGAEGVTADAPKPAAKPTAKPADKPTERVPLKPLPKPKSSGKAAPKPAPAPAPKPAPKPIDTRYPPAPVPHTRVTSPSNRFAERFSPPKPPARGAYEPMETVKTAHKADPRLANAWKSKSGRDLTEPELMAMPEAVYMNDVQLDFFRHRLTGLKDDLLSNAGETTEHLREDTTIVPDPADRATIEEEHALELRTRDRERKLLKKISQSLTRIEAGDYGFCDETGEPIGLGRLLARPTATLSLEAQQRREMKQKMFGD